MKAKVIATRKIVDVSFHCQKQSGEYVYRDNSFGTTSRTWTKEELVFFEEPIDWEQRRFELVKAVVQGMSSNNPLRSIDTIVSKGIGIADAVIAKLKEESV